VKRWTHGHSLGTGVLFGAVLFGYRPWLVFAAGLIVGAFAVVAWRFGCKVAHGVGRSVAAYTLARAKKELRERRHADWLASLRQSDEVPF
jgi:hypothetical protein